MGLGEGVAFPAIHSIIARRCAPVLTMLDGCNASAKPSMTEQQLPA